MRRRASGVLLGVLCGAIGLLAVQCGAPGSAGSRASAGAAKASGSVAEHDPATAAAAWEVIYGVLEHPRCANCHPAGDQPLQGDLQKPHLQNVQRGPAGEGVPAMHCDTCHQTGNTAGRHMPPGAPKWHLPKPEMPLVFVGKTSEELCKQLRDPAQNGGKTPEQLFEHMASDPLVMWGWNPGEGRQPVATPHDELVRALRVWIDGGCGCPGE
jgi:hypothetical protein